MFHQEPTPFYLNKKVFNVIIICKSESLDKIMANQTRRIQKVMFQLFLLNPIELLDEILYFTVTILFVLFDACLMF